MSKIVRITQETFDAAVIENIDLLEMGPNEAVSEAIQQFESQGVNLDTIVKEFRFKCSSQESIDHVAVAAVRQLEKSIQQEPLNHSNVEAACNNLTDVCMKGLAERCLAAKNGCFEALISLMNLSILNEDAALLATVLTTLVSFIDGQPDIVTESASQTFVGLLERQPRPTSAVLTGVLRVINLACIKHEANRQRFVELAVIQAVSILLHDDTTDSDTVRAACSVYSSLTLDDDIRVAFGKSHDHAKMIVIEGNAVAALLNLAKVYSNDVDVLTDIFGVVARLCVRDEFCQQVVDTDGIVAVFTALQNFISYQGLLRSLLIFIKVLAGSDRAKVEITRAGGIELILEAVRSHHKTAGICETGFAAIGAIVLRFPAHSDLVVDAAGAEVICTAMELHADSIAVQMAACSCIRNIVSRRLDLAEAFLSIGAEALLRRTFNKHKQCRDEAKSALRDLGCHVDLKERWTGSGRELARD